MTRALPIKGITYRIEVNEAELGSGATAAPFTVPAMGEVEFDMQITANLAGALSKLLSRRDSGSLDLPIGRRRQSSQRLSAPHSVRRAWHRQALAVRQTASGIRCIAFPTRNRSAWH